jgi:hypothetical protein
MWNLPFRHFLITVDCNHYFRFFGNIIMIFSPTKKVLQAWRHPGTNPSHDSESVCTEPTWAVKGHRLDHFLPFVIGQREETDNPSPF